jgi:hypothetical protein
VLHSESQCTLLALVHGRGDAVGARDAEGCAGMERGARDRAHDEVHVN